MADDEDGEPLCNISGLCEGPKGASLITNCIHCGKELHEKNGWWYTWDADTCENPEPQSPVLE